jgi:hypothetical protein
MISISTTTTRISLDSKIQQASRDGKKKIMQNLHWIQQTPKKKEEEKEIEKKNLSPGDGFSSGIV